MNNGELVKVIQHTGVGEQRELVGTHEEADTRILHIVDLATTHSRNLVRCDDTDIRVFLIYYNGKYMFGNCKVYTNAGHCSKTNYRQRFIPVNEIASTIWQDASLYLVTTLTCYISVCDPTPSLFKIGKQTVYNMVMVNIGDLLTLAEVGQSSGNQWTYHCREVCVATVWIEGNSCQSLNLLCYNYACKSDTSASLYPPTLWYLSTIHNKRQLPCVFMDPQS